MALTQGQECTLHDLCKTCKNYICAYLCCKCGSPWHVRWRRGLEALCCFPHEGCCEICPGSHVRSRIAWRVRDMSKYRVDMMSGSRLSSTKCVVQQPPFLLTL
eukprot:2745028-Amphidinium_carterae.1